MTSQADKNRKFPRVPVYRRARVELEKDSVSATVFEIGAGGCGVRLEKAIEVGTLVRVVLFDQKRIDPLKFNAVVKWSSNVEGSGVHSCGIQFLSLVEGSSERSLAEVESLLESTGHRLKKAA